MQMRSISTALAGGMLALVTLAAPAAAAPRDAQGELSISAQAMSTHGLVLGARPRFRMGPSELGATLMMPLANPLGFFTVDGYMAFVGSTRAFLPIDLQPVMGFGGAGFFRDVPATTGTGTTTDLAMYLYMPVGLRYAFRAGGFALGAEALYHLPAVYMMKPKSDPGRLHLELSTQLGPLTGGVFYDHGPVYNGPGVRIGGAFF